MYETYPDEQIEERRPPIVVQVAAVIGGVVAICAFVLCALYFYFVQPPADFPVNSEVEIERGMSVADIATHMKRAGYVRSETLLYALLAYRSDPARILAGRYVFEGALSARGVAAHLTEVGPDEELVTLTFPEGIRVTEIASIANDALEDFNSATFLSFATEKEGYLFPDTYHVPLDFTAEELYDLMLSTYEEKRAARADMIAAHPLSEYEILILASIIEREARSEESMRIVSGILQNRLAIGMALQADASIEYVLNKPLNELVPEDLEIDTPYNTYLYPGLPPTPIGNPGRMAVDAVLMPIESDYFYYITDDSGEFHYAETYDAHRRNIAEYLR